MTISAPSTTQDVDERAFRDAMGEFATGVTVVAADDGENAHALTASSFTSVSLEPPLVLICINNGSQFCEIATRAGAFAVHMLCYDQSDAAMLFATASTEERVAALIRAPGEPPRLEGAQARFSCAVEDAHQAGDHTVFIGRVLHLEAEPQEPLIWWRRRFWRGPNS